MIGSTRFARVLDRRRRRGLARAGLATALILALGGCGSVSDTLGNLPFLGKKKTVLLGDRQPVFPSAGASDAAAKPASIGPQQAMFDWPQPGGNPQNDPGNVAYSGNGARLWRASVGSNGGRGGILSFGRESLRLSARPVAAGGRLFVYAPDGSVTALSLENGGRVWHTSLRPEHERSQAPGGGVAVDNGRVFAATGFRTVAALDAATGKVIWKKDIEVPARSAPTATGGKIYLVTQTNEVYGLSEADGSEVFHFTGIPADAGLLTTASPAVAGGTVVVPLSSGQVVALDAQKGDARWGETVVRATRTSAMSDLADVSASPVIAGDVVYATGIAGRTIAVSLSSGKTLWELDLGSAHTPAVSGNAMFLITLGDEMVAIDRAKGTVLWKTQLPRGNKKRMSTWAGPLLAGNKLWAISNKGQLIALSATDGKILGNSDVASAGFASPVMAGGRMIVLSDAGEVSALR